MSVNFKSENVQKYKELSDKIKETLTTQETSIKEKESHGAYYANLPEGFDRKAVEDLAKYNSKFVTAAHIAVGELATEIFKSKKSIDSVDAEMGYFGKADSINVAVVRTKTYQNHLAKEESEREVTKQLVMHTTVTSQSAKGYGLKAVREAMSEEFAGMFKK